MNEKSVEVQPFFRPLGEDPQGRERFRANPTTVGPWRPDSQHGGPPAALLARAIELLPAAQGMLLARFTMELLRPVPVAEVATTARVVRPGRRVAFAESTLYDAPAGQPIALAQAWLLPGHRDGPGSPTPPATGPDQHCSLAGARGWGGGYIDAMEWRWVSGDAYGLGPGAAWMRSPDLVEGEPITPVQRVLAGVDSASGISGCLDTSHWAFLNTELTVHLLRPPEGEWVLVDAETTLSDGSAGLATSTISDIRGVVGRSAQTLLVQQLPER